MNEQNLEEQLRRLTTEVDELRGELESIRESPYVRSSIKHLGYEVLIDREEVRAQELGKGINEKHGTMFEVKSQAKRLASFLGLDADMIRMMVTEAIQNIVEHGYGQHALVRLEIRNDCVNPHLVASFKHELKPGVTYTMAEINENALKGDATSEYFDFESARGRGEFIMKQLTDERRVINGTEINEEGRKVHYFKRILINYRDPDGPRERVSFAEIKGEIDRLDYEDVVCCFHVDHVADRPDRVTIATHKSQGPRVAEMMARFGFDLLEEEPYYRTLFATYVPKEPADKEQLLNVFAAVRKFVYEESEEKP